MNGIYFNQLTVRRVIKIFHQNWVWVIVLLPFAYFELFYTNLPMIELFYMELLLNYSFRSCLFSLNLNYYKLNNIIIHTTK